MPNRKSKNKAWVIDVSMGYGHQRTAYPLKDIAFGDIIKADNYKGIPALDKMIWEESREFYEAVSRCKNIPLIGEFIFGLFDELQKIYPFYPKKDRTELKAMSKISYKIINAGWGNDLIKKISTEKIPFISTFFTPAFMAERFNYPGDIYVVVCDTDISRSWSPENPGKSRIKYFAPTEMVVQRLRSYGVKEKNIYYTGYPLPEKNLGDKTLTLLREDIKKRLINLDPYQTYFNKYKSHIEFHLGKLPEKSGRKLTIMFAIGGAGAQKEIVFEIITSLAEKIRNNQINIILVAGTRKEVKDYFLKRIVSLKLRRSLKRNIKIIYQKKIEDYFDEFNSSLRVTDILFTKPSELSFYSALGIPIVIMPDIGYQEKFNKEWLLNQGFGILMQEPNSANEWLDDFLKYGYFADIAMQSFVENKQNGIFDIKNIILKKR
ncbi:MAG TPA: hypothetical protein PLA41_00215 [Candidatus Pacearchaeota archaeon]|nr:hypothetical protein [Candidatus Pacearchaeota archaeon]HQI74277.1 hypothetical protein [Candidatus Pacearchaeota archaeon]